MLDLSRILLVDPAQEFSEPSADLIAQHAEPLLVEPLGAGDHGYVLSLVARMHLEFCERRKPLLNLFARQYAGIAFDHDPLALLGADRRRFDLEQSAGVVAEAHVDALLARGRCR